ncbi:MAG: hypothetical protein B9S26_13420 [Opitutia bacterium Tous-C4FEB]|nr:MAG: hypothetical protein B9S35_08325 [Opitutae bacterium Tous-C5TDCM]PAW87787.1 MAG: hypothetical protein B9S26_13420 [Opitutae bacterium Tous-C4FEB]
METISGYAKPSGSEKIWSLLSHLSGLIGVPFLLPLVVYLSMRGDSRYVIDNAREALNFHLSILLYCLICLLLSVILIGLPLMILIGLAYLVLSIIAAVKAADGGCYRYPLTLRFVR